MPPKLNKTSFASHSSHELPTAPKPNRTVPPASLSSSFKDGSIDNDRTSHAENICNHAKPTPYQMWLATNPAFSFLLFFSINFGLILTSILLQGSGVSVISMDKITQIGLDIPDDVYQMRANAYEAAKDEADFGLSGIKCPREEMQRAPLQMILESSSSSILSKEGLTELQKLEDFFIKTAEWKEKCSLLWADSPTCENVAIYNSAANPHWVNKPNVTDVNGCILPSSPVTFFIKYGDPTFSSIDATLAKIKSNANDWSAFTDLLDRDFSIEKPKTNVMKTTIYYGTPFKNYTYYMKLHGDAAPNNPDHYEYYTRDHVEIELSELQDYFEGDHVKEYLESNFNGLGGDGDRGENEKYIVSYSHVNYNPMEQLVLGDISKIVVSIFFVFTYMWYSTGSFFITCCGLFQIFTSFAGANLVYRFLWPSSDGFGYEYFTLFCGLAMFVIMGIGADDVFVYWDTWNQSFTSTSHKHANKADRLAHVYGHAVNAMFVTSATTVISFFSNLSSNFIGVRTFGLFAGLLVAVNFISVCTFFPATVLFYDKFLKNTRFCFGIISILKMKLVDYFQKRKLCPFFCGVKAPLPSKPRLSIIEEDKLTQQDDESKRWWKNTYAPWLFKYRFVVTALFITVFGIFSVGAAMISPTPLEVHELFPHGSNYYTFVKNSLTRFPSTSRPLLVHLVFGIEVDDPVDYGNEKKTEFLPAGDKSGEVSGRVNWDRSFLMDRREFQQQYVDLCNEVASTLSADPKYKINKAFGINPQYDENSNGVLGDSEKATFNGIQCVLNGFKLFNNVTGMKEINLDANANTETTSYDVSGFHDIAQFEFPTVRDGAWDITPANEDNCHYCFDAFTLSNFQSAHVTKLGVLTNTSRINRNCNCMGLFPVPSNICFSDFNYLEEDNPFRCTETSMFKGFLSTYTSLGGNKKMWANYLFATKDENNKFLKIAMTEISAQTTLNIFDKDAWAGMSFVEAWDDWAAEYNERTESSAKVMVQIETAPKWKQTILLMPAAINGVVLSLFLSWCVLVFATENYLIATFAALTIAMIVVIVFGFLTFSGWGLGLLEGILVVLVIGFSVDYTVHLSDSYKVSSKPTRFLKVQDALDSVGDSILSGAVSTIGAAAIMLSASISFFSKFGAFIFLTIILSTTFSLGFYCCLLMIAGPIGGTGNVANLFSDLIKSAETKLLRDEEMFKKEREANAAMRVHDSRTL